MLDYNSLAEKFPASDTVPISSKRHVHGRELCAAWLGIILMAHGSALTGWWWHLWKCSMDWGIDESRGWMELVTKSGEKFLCSQRLLELLTLNSLSSWMSTALGNPLGMLAVISLNSRHHSCQESAFSQIPVALCFEAGSGQRWSILRWISDSLNFSVRQEAYSFDVCHLGCVNVNTDFVRTVCSQGPLRAASFIDIVRCLFCQGVLWKCCHKAGKCLLFTRVIYFCEHFNFAFLNVSLQFRGNVFCAHEAQLVHPARCICEDVVLCCFHVGRRKWGVCQTDIFSFCLDQSESMAV